MLLSSKVKTFFLLNLNVFVPVYTNFIALLNEAISNKVNGKGKILESSDDLRKKQVTIDSTKRPNSGTTHISVTSEMIALSNSYAAYFVVRRE